MGKILRITEAVSEVSRVRGVKVLVGGCFDILHIGHITFLEKARRKGNYLILLLESDQTIKKLKGDNRPVNNQTNRAELLSHLDLVDLVILLPEMADQVYDSIIMELKPQVIATTLGDPGIKHKKRQANLVGAKLIAVTKRVKGFSSTNLIDLKSV